MFCRFCFLLLFPIYDFINEITYRRMRKVCSILWLPCVHNQFPSSQSFKFRFRVYHHFNYFCHFSLCDAHKINISRAANSATHINIRCESRVRHQCFWSGRESDRIKIDEKLFARNRQPRTQSSIKSPFAEMVGLRIRLWILWASGEKINQRKLCKNQRSRDRRCYPVEFPNSKSLHSHSPA